MRKPLARKNKFGKPQSKRPTKKPSALKRNKSWLFYGRSGTGKTTITGTFPSPICIIDFKDEGTESIADIENAEVYEVTSVEELEEAYWWIKGQGDFFKTVVLDTTTAMQIMIVREVASQSKMKKRGKRAGDWGSMTQKDWGKASGLMTKFVTDFKDLDVETVFLAQEKVFDPDEGGDDAEGELSPEVGPANMKSVSAHMCASCSFIGHTFVRMVDYKVKMKRRRRPEYCIRVGPNPVYITKVRKPKAIKLPDFVADPSYDSLMKLREGKFENGQKDRKEKR